MKPCSVTFLLLLGATTVGCAYSQTMRLPANRPSAAALERVVIEDARPAADKETSVITAGGTCARVYGDKFIEPSKVEYLRGLLAERLAPTAPLVIRLERFDTIERCELYMRRFQQNAIANAGGGRVRLATGPGDDFTLQMVGTANGVPFRFRRTFDYSDLGARGMPSDHPKYQARVERLFGNFAEALSRSGVNHWVPASAIVDPRAVPAASATDEASSVDG
jgi:hypothetical protein